MTTTITKKRDIKVLNKDFNALRQDLINHLKVYFPDDYQDFNQSSVGMMLTEISAFVGDALNFYLDKKFQESFLSTAREKKNIFKHGKSLGFKAFGKTTSFGKVNGYISVPNTVSAGKDIPDMSYAGKVRKGAKLSGKNGKIYETLVDIDFSKVDINDTNYTRVAKRQSNNRPSTWALKVPNVDVIAGETKTKTFTIGEYTPFLKLQIPDNDVLEIISVTDSEGNDWYEVDYLAQDTVFASVENTNADLVDVPYTLKLLSVPRRFISMFDISTNKTYLQFGTGDAAEFDTDLIPNIGDLSLPLVGKDTLTDFAIDPQNFLKTRTLGLAPTSTTLTVRYRIGGGLDSNIGAKQLISVNDYTFDIGVTGLVESSLGETKNSFSVDNDLPIFGGRDEYKNEELVELISANFSAQNRLVTPEDFIARALSMPSKYGSIFRAYAKSSRVNKNAVELSVVSRDGLGKLATAPSTLKSNLKTYLNKFRMMTDAIDILDTEIINISIFLGILVKPEYNKSDVMLSCIQALKEYFDITKWQISQPINRTEVRTLIAQLSGVYSVYGLEMYNKNGLIKGVQYSSSAYNLSANTVNDIIICKENSIFELKYPNKDIYITAK